MNVVISEGHLTKKPELQTSKNGKLFCYFSLGLARKVPKDYQGQKADFPNYVAWGKTAEYLCEYGYKGALVSVVGSLGTRSYESGGKKNYVTEVSCLQVNVLSRQEYPELPEPMEEKEEIVIDTDELPFY